VARSGPHGIFRRLSRDGPYQSAHHSHTFPCMSYRPQAFGRFRRRDGSSRMRCHETTHGLPGQLRRHRAKSVSCGQPGTRTPTPPRSAAGTGGRPLVPPAMRQLFAELHCVVPAHILHRLPRTLRRLDRSHHMLVLLLGHLVDAQMKRLCNPHFMLLRPFRTPTKTSSTGLPIRNGPAGMRLNCMPILFVIVSRPGTADGVARGTGVDEVTEPAPGQSWWAHADSNTTVRRRRERP